MNDQRLYVIDANIFMQAARTYYSFSRAPTFWDTLLQYANEGKIISIDKVFQEIKQGNEDDPLRMWAKDEFVSYFDTTKTEEILTCYKELVNWADKQKQFQQTAKDEFMDEENADAWVIAFAKVNKGVLVTSEVPAPGSKKRIPIPSVCDAFNVEYCDLFSMLDQLKFAF